MGGMDNTGENLKVPESSPLQVSKKKKGKKGRKNKNISDSEDN
mgnify:CR=1 FL=1|jgi:hypothetical protein